MLKKIPVTLGLGSEQVGVLMIDDEHIGLFEFCVLSGTYCTKQEQEVLVEASFVPVSKLKNNQ